MLSLATQIDQLRDLRGKGKDVPLSGVFVDLLDKIWTTNRESWTNVEFEAATGSTFEVLCNWKKKPTGNAAAGTLAVICCVIGCDPTDLGLGPASCEVVREFIRLRVPSALRTAQSNLKHLLGQELPSELSEVLYDVLGDCHPFLAWIKPYHYGFHLLYGGGVRAESLDNQSADVLRRLIFKPSEWVNGAVPDVVVPDCWDWLKGVIRRWPKDARERNSAYITGLTANVRSEVYLPINGPHLPVACLNIHFPELMPEAELLEVVKTTEAQFKVNAVAERIADALRRELEAASRVVHGLGQGEFRALTNTVNAVAHEWPYTFLPKGDRVDLGAEIEQLLVAERLTDENFIVTEKELLLPTPLENCVPKRAVRPANDPVLAGVASRDALRETLLRAFRDLRAVGSFEVAFGRIASTPLAHITISERSASNTESSEFAKLLSDFQAARKMWEARGQSDADAFLNSTEGWNTRFEFIYAACIISRLSCGQVRIAAGAAPALRLEIPRAEMLPVPRHRA